jgi:alanine racemase
MVRIGTAIYGHQPSDEMLRRLPLRGVLRLVGRLTQVKDVPAGSYVSYGRTYRFDHPARIGLVPIGYADGYWRAFSNRAVMRIGGRAVPVRGRVCMDQTIIELTGLPNVKVGDEVEIVSPDAEAPNSIENLARLAGTISPEVMSRFSGPRIRRVAAT